MTVPNEPEPDTRRVVVFGSSGFVGTAVAAALHDRGVTVDAQSGRQLIDRCAPHELHSVDDVPAHVLEDLVERLRGATAVVNCAGIPDASSKDDYGLNVANGLLPTVIAKAVSKAAVPRFVHVSSAAVQWRAHTLDAGGTDPRSPYSRSKVLGEQGVREHAADAGVVYRPATVHGAGRAVTERLVRLARSRLSSVASPGTQPTPVSLVENVADAVVFLALHEGAIPEYVSHPWENLSCADLLQLISGQPPRNIPRNAARMMTETTYRLGSVGPRLMVLARRAEMLWFGQKQEVSWLTEAGWFPRFGREAWASLGDSAEHGAANSQPL